MRKLILVGLLAMMMGGCYKEGPLKEEKADVIQMAYVPSTSGTGMGLSSGGNLVVVSNDTDEVWAVVVKCREHGKTFSLRGKDIYEKCKVGQVITLRYVEYLNSEGKVKDFKTKEVIP